MSDLVVDIGNSRIKWALAASGRVIGSGRAVAHDNLELLFAEWSRLSAPPQRVRLANVTQAPVAQAITDWVVATWQAPVETTATPAMGGGITIAYPDPTQLGTDRWLAMVGARAAGYLPACIVDCGSAITLDVVDGQGHHQGGLILPGLAAQQAGIAQVAPALPPVELGAGTPLLTHNTADALASGYLHGTAAAVQGLIRRCLAESSEPLTPVLTGGDAQLMARYLDMDVRLRPDVILEGLATLP